MDAELILRFREDYRAGCGFLLITSRRQDVGIRKCEQGVQLGLLRKVTVQIDEQETHWRYYWTEKAVELFSQPD